MISVLQLFIIAPHFVDYLKEEMSTYLEFKAAFQLHYLNEKRLATETRKNKNLSYSIHMYWTNFWRPTVHVLQNIFEIILI